ncbi:hypothetical protein E2C01_036062 [Portunus trituberculatus]|uniref:Uncharacterized protein n=1 Tax=Portunus trituberculatus TaxID=210409 RepID=A0A5B7F4T6_PORTR|nr:hypothetical protein [Portunus trituberculatus]
MTTTGCEERTSCCHIRQGGGGAGRGAAGLLPGRRHWTFSSIPARPHLLPMTSRGADLTYNILEDAVQILDARPSHPPAGIPAAVRHLRPRTEAREQRPASDVNLVSGTSQGLAEERTERKQRRMNAERRATPNLRKYVPRKRRSRTHRRELSHHPQPRFALAGCAVQEHLCSLCIIDYGCCGIVGLAYFNGAGGVSQVCVASPACIYDQEASEILHSLPV